MLKKGNHRHVARLSLLMPLWQKDDKLLFGCIITIVDSRRVVVSNLSFFYRRLIDEFILGGYGYYDLR